MTTLQHPTLQDMTFFNGTSCNIQSEKVDLNNNTMVAIKPTQDSSKTQLSGIFGISREIMIVGKFVEYIDPTGQTANDIYLTDFVSEIDGWVNTGNPISKTYVSSFGTGVSNWRVLPIAFTYNYTVESTKVIEFVLKIVQGTKVT